MLTEGDIVARVQHLTRLRGWVRAKAGSNRPTGRAGLFGGGLPGRR